MGFEIIVSADGTDGTGAVMAKLAASDTRIEVIGKPERLGKGRGIRKAVGIAGDSCLQSVSDNKRQVIDIFKIVRIVKRNLHAGVPVEEINLRRNLWIC